MVPFSERFNLVDCMHEYRVAVNIHGDDVLAHNNWEISESWLQRYKYAFIFNRPMLSNISSTGSSWTQPR